MMTEQWKRERFEEYYETTYRQLELRRQEDPNFTIKELQGLLDTAYINEGNDYVGRGGAYEIQQAATIAAYEAFLSDWKENG